MNDSNNENTMPPTISEDPAVEEARRLSFWSSPWIVAAAVPVLMLAGVSIFFAFWNRPYFALSPGSVRETTGRVEIAGADVYLPEGEIGFVTISLKDRISMWEYIAASIDDSVELIEEDKILRDATPEEKRAQDQRRMQNSKDDASVAALEYLGYVVPRIGQGVEVAALIPCMPAEDLLTVGDLILSVNGIETPLRVDLRDALAGANPGDVVELRVDRIETGIELIDVELGSSADPCLAVDGQEVEPVARPLMGIQLAESDLVIYDLPIDIEIDSDRVGGPSAGLSFTLAIIDVLTPGELTGGASIATTGEINVNGQVGRIGGIKQKTIAARKDGVALFVVPIDELEIALQYAGDDMVVVGVTTLSEAIDALTDFGGNGNELAAFTPAATPDGS